jgi:Fic family protein
MREKMSKMITTKYNDVVKLWKEYNVRTQVDIDHRLDNFRILFAYNSNKIENEAITYSDTREIFENGHVLNYSGNPRTLFELANQKTCYEFLKPKIAVKEPLSIELIKDIHGILTSGTYDERRFVEQGERPGEFKKHDYVTGIAEVGSLPEEVEKDLIDLLGELSSNEKKDILVVAAYFHAQFEYIHPFADGNGRVGRTLLNYLLMIHDHPPIIVHNEDKQRYYCALSHYDQDENLEPLLTFLKQQTERTWEKTLERVRRSVDRGR